MCLIAPEELQEAMLADIGETSDPEQEKLLSQLVESGFKSWQSFHARFAQTQREIRQMPAGLSRWDDIESFLVTHGGAKVHTGVTTTRFKKFGETIVSEEAPAKVLLLKNGRYGLAGDYEGAPLKGDTHNEILRLGLNAPEVLSLLRELALPKESVGAALLRWAEVGLSLQDTLGKSVVILGFLRQKLQLEHSGGANELGTELVFYSACAALKSVRRFDETQHRLFLRNLRNFTVRMRAGEMPMPEEWLALQNRLAGELMNPSGDERIARIRYAVFPILVAHIEP